MIFRKLADKIEQAPVSYLIGVFFVVALAVFFLSLFNGFVWDDEEQILNNPFINKISNIPYLFTTSTFSTGGAGLSGLYYKPLMPVFFSLIHAFAGYTSFFYHFFDLLIHLINTVLIFFFFKKFFDYFKYEFSRTFSFCFSLIFLIHPVVVEAVSYISSTQELLYVLFLLLALLFSFNFLTKKESPAYLVIINSFVLGSLLSKEAGVISIPIILCLAFILNKKQIFPLLLSFSSTFVLYLILRLPIAKTPFLQYSSIIPIANASLFQRIITIPYELFSYTRLTFSPIDLYVAQYTVVRNLSEPRFYLSTLILVALISFLLFIFRKFYSKSTIFFLFWILASFALILNIYPLDMTIAERWMYGPLIGILGLIAVISQEVINRNKKYLDLFIFSFLIFFSFFVVRSFIRTYDWNNDLSLFSHDIRYVPNSFDTQNNLGVALFREGKIDDAALHFQKSIELSPKWWIAYNNLGAVYQKQGKTKQAKALYQKSIDTGNYYLAYENLAEIKTLTEKPNGVLPFVEKSLRILPDNEKLNKIAAYLYLKSGKLDRAESYANRTYLINPSQDNYFFVQQILSEEQKQNSPK